MSWLANTENSPNRFNSPRSESPRYSEHDSGTGRTQRSLNFDATPQPYRRPQGDAGYYNSPSLVHGDSSHLEGEFMSSDSHLFSHQPNRTIVTPYDDNYVSSIGDLGFCALSSLTRRLLTHPFIAFRNQSQLINRTMGSYQLFPWCPVSPLYNIYRNQGTLALWKGLPNDIIIDSCQRAIEVIISENSTLPTSVNPRPKDSVIGLYTKHLILKTISTVLTTPLICAGYVLRVQSQVVAGDLDFSAIFKEAYQRLMSSAFIYKTETSHMLPLYHLVFPITTLCISRYIVHGMVMATVQRQYQLDSITLSDPYHEELPLIKVLYDKYYPQLIGGLSGYMLADIFLYPLSTVTGRLILQGTRTIIDDVETGNAVLPVNYHYSGLWDCFQSIVREEGVLGLYKGFGALIMQYTVQAMVLRGFHVLYEKIMELHYPRVPRRRVESSMTASSTYSSVQSLNNPELN